MVRRKMHMKPKPKAKVKANLPPGSYEFRILESRDKVVADGTTIRSHRCEVVSPEEYAGVRITLIESPSYRLPFVTKPLKEKP